MNYQFSYHYHYYTIDVIFFDPLDFLYFRHIYFAFCDVHDMNIDYTSYMMMVGGIAKKKKKKTSCARKKSSRESPKKNFPIKKKETEDPRTRKNTSTSNMQDMAAERPKDPAAVNFRAGERNCRSFFILAKTARPHTVIIF